MYALCQFWFPEIITSLEVPASQLKVLETALNLRNFIVRGKSELVDVYEFLGEIQDNYDEDSIPASGTYLTVSIEIEEKFISSWKDSEAEITKSVIEELGRPDLHLSTMNRRDTESRIYLVKDYD